MDIYQVNHQQLLKGIRCNFQRYLYKQIQWDDRLIGIFGSQGVGKTTLLLQRIKQAFDDSDKALYLNLDSILFQREKMVNVAMQFYKEGGTHLFLDSVHRYADWMAETRKLLERCFNILQFPIFQWIKRRQINIDHLSHPVLQTWLLKRM